jgi:ketosteroid isomerase-like protein
MAMSVNRLLAYGILLLCVLHSKFALSATTPSAANGLDHVWFGSFVDTLPNGKITHNVTALILEQDGSKLSGSVGPSIDRLAPIVTGSISGDNISFRIEGGGGIAFALRLNDGHLVGTAVGSRVNAVLDLTPAPGLMPHAQLVAEITAADAQNFAAYDSCNADQYMASLSPDLEFYQDNQPVKNRQQIIDSLNYRCTEGIKFRRELDQSSLIINSAPPYCAIEAGLHRIYSKQPDGSEQLEATVRFTLVWSKKSGTWQLIRVVSYDHR